MGQIFLKNLYSAQNEYQIEIIKNKNGVETIIIERYFHQKSDSEPSEKITIHKGVLNDLIDGLIECKDQIEKSKTPEKISPNSLPYIKTSSTSSIPKKIQDRYLRGVSIPDLCIQFDMKADIIERILRKAGITIISKKESQPFYYRRNTGKN